MPGREKRLGTTIPSHWDPEYGNQCGSYRTGAVSGIGSGLHHYLDGLLCHKPGNFPGVKMESEEGFPEMSADSDGKSQIMIATLEEYSFRSGDPVHGAGRLWGNLWINILFWD